MADRSRDKDKKPVFDAELPADEELEEEPDESAEDEAEDEDVEGEDVEGGDEDEGFEEAAPSRKKGGGAFAFSLRRGHKAEEEAGKRAILIGSVKETHERIHIDDRPSAIFALVCAVALLVLLGLPWLGNVLPKSAGPTLTPLVVPTGQATASSSASASIAVSPSPTVAPSASASASASTK